MCRMKNHLTKIHTNVDVALCLMVPDDIKNMFSELKNLDDDLFQLIVVTSKSRSNIV